MGKKDLQRHQSRENNNKKYSCGRCDNVFEEKSQPRDHIGIHVLMHIIKNTDAKYVINTSVFEATSTDMSRRIQLQTDIIVKFAKQNSQDEII